MQGDTQIRVHKIGKNSVIEEASWSPWASNAPFLHDAMELGMVTIEILGIPVNARTFWQWREVWVVCTTLSLRECVPFLQLCSSDRRGFSRRERRDHITVWRR
jgi:hypothetical protein